MKFILFIAVIATFCPLSLRADDGEALKAREASKEKALRMYPDAGDNRTPLGKAIAKRIAELQAKNDPVLYTETAPYIITRDCAEELNIYPIGQLRSQYTSSSHAQISQGSSFSAPEYIFPPNGKTCNGTNRDCIAPLEIRSQTGANYLVKLVNIAYPEEYFEVFVRGGNTVNVDVPIGSYIFKYASGEKWYGDQYLFGPKTACSKASTAFTFQQKGDEVIGCSVTLYKIVGGNLNTEKIKPSEF